MELFDMEKVGPQVKGEGSRVFPGDFAGGIEEEGCVVGGGCGKITEQQKYAQELIGDMGGVQAGGYRRRATRRRRRVSRRKSLRKRLRR